jgi:hypothetical protein
VKAVGILLLVWAIVMCLFGGRVLVIARRVRDHREHRAVLLIGDLSYGFGVLLFIAAVWFV